jgi:transposase
LQVVLNRRDKEQLVIELHRQGKTIREIASAAHLSFTGIGAIVRKFEGKDEETKDLKNSPRRQKLYSSLQMERNLST